MAGLGQALTGVNQANQRAAALRRFDPSALAGAEQFLGLDPQQQQMAELRLALLKRLLSGEQPGGAQAAPGGPGAEGGLSAAQFDAMLGGAGRGAAFPSFERAPDERRQMDVRIGGGPPGSPERALRGLSGMIEGPEAQALAAMAGPQMPGTRVPPQAVAARGAPMGGLGGAGGGGDLPGGGMPEGLAALLGGLKSPRTRGELARMEPQLQVLEKMLALEQAAQMKKALAAMAEEGRAARAAAKEQGVERRHGETIGSREKVAGQSLEQRKTEADELNKYRDATLTLRGRAQEAMGEYRKALLDFKAKGDKRADTDKFYRLVSAYSQVGLSMGDDAQREKVQAQLGREIEAEMRKRGFPEDITGGVITEQPGYFERAMNWLGKATGLKSSEKPKGGKPAVGPDLDDEAMERMFGGE